MGGSWLQAAFVDHYIYAYVTYLPSGCRVFVAGRVLLHETSYS